MSTSVVLPAPVPPTIPTVVFASIGDVEIESGLSRRFG
jgi:hypothetical protein